MAQCNPSRYALDALVVGTPFVDVVLSGVPHWPGAGEEVWARQRAVCPGGAANNAVVLARLGRRTALAGTIGADPIGDLVVRLLEAEPDLSLDLLDRDPHRLTPFTLAVGDGGDRSFISHGDMPSWTPAEDAGDSARPRSLFLSLGAEPSPWLGSWHAAGTLIVAGLGFDEHLGWPRSVLERLADVDVLVCNEREALEYTRRDSTEAALRVLADRVPLAVVTLGAAGALALGASGPLGPPSRAAPARSGITAVKAVATTAVDATGAGDAFAAGLMDALLHPGVHLDDALKHASLVSSLVVSGLGGSASAPTRRQLLDRALDLGPDYSFEGDWLATPVH